MVQYTVPNNLESYENAKIRLSGRTTALSERLQKAICKHKGAMQIYGVHLTFHFDKNRTVTYLSQPIRLYDWLLEVKMDFLVTVQE